jgi:D-threo-aldose 1-dehydrogenase
MRRQILSRSGLETSRLGFGCVQLTAHRDRRQAVAVLEHAFAEGITHFDVARAYGFGRTESILAEFLRGKRGQVTVATKFGLQPPSGLAGNGRIIDAARRILRPFPGLLHLAKARGAAMGKSGAFTPDAAIQSLETSLRELSIDYLDLLLLHEASLAEAGNLALIETLERQVGAGKVRHLGIASDFEKLPADIHEVPAQYKVLQFNDNAGARNLGRLMHTEQRDFITHSIFKPAGPLLNTIAQQPHIAREFSLQMDVDLSDPKVIRSFLLGYALRSNRSGLVLFSSTAPEHITANVRQLEAPDCGEAQSTLFLEFAQTMLSSQAVAAPAAVEQNPPVH